MLFINTHLNSIKKPFEAVAQFVFVLELFFSLVFYMASSFNSKWIHMTTNKANVMVVATQQTVSARPKCFDLNCFRFVLFSRSVMVIIFPVWGNFSFTFAASTNSSMSLISCGIFVVSELKREEKITNVDLQLFDSNH